MVDGADRLWLEVIDENRSRPGTYVLNGKDRMYCITGESQKKTSKSPLETRIREDRIQEIPQRFQDLFDDIALIDYSDVDFLSVPEKRDLWKELIKIETRGSRTHAYDTRSPRPPTYRRQFGLELGAMLRRLDYHTSINETNPELVWGFIIGLHNLPTKHKQTESDIIGRLLSTLDEKRSERSGTLSTRNEQKELKNQIYETFYNSIKDALKEYDIEIEQLPSNISWERELDHSSEITKKAKLEQSIEDNLNISRFKKLIKLKQVVEEDISQIESHQWRKQDASEVIRDIWRESKVNDGKTINVSNLSTAKNNNLAKKIINDYSSSPDEDRLPANHQIIDKNNGACKLTKYGKLVSYCLFDNDKECSWIQTYNIFYEYNNKRSKDGNTNMNERLLIEDATTEIGFDIDNSQI